MSTATTVEDISGAGTGSKALKKVPLPTASLGDAKLLRELLLLRTSLLKADVKLTGAYTGPPIPMATEAMTRIYKLMQNASLAKFCEVHLRLNDLHYESYELTEKRLEDVETRSDNTDFYMAAKIDTHLHLSAILTSPELLSYLNEIYARDGHLPYDSKQTIGEMILAAGFEPGRTAIDDLRTQSTPDMYREGWKKIRAYAEAAGRSIDDISPGLVRTLTIAGSREEARQLAVAEQGRVYRQDFERLVDKYDIYGTPEDCIKGIEKYIDAGARHIVFQWRCPMADSPANMKLAGEKILPYFRSH